MSRVRKKFRSIKPATPVLPQPTALEPLLPILPGFNYTAPEVARHLRLKNYRTLTVWRCQGRHPELRHVKIGSKILYRGQDILDFLAGKPAEKRRRRKV